MALNRPKKPSSHSRLTESKLSRTIESEFFPAILLLDSGIQVICDLWMDGDKDYILSRPMKIGYVTMEEQAPDGNVYGVSKVAIEPWLPFTDESLVFLKQNKVILTTEPKNEIWEAYLQMADLHFMDYSEELQRHIDDKSLTIAGMPSESSFFVENDFSGKAN